MQHVEFFHTDHFEKRYRRIRAKKSLSEFIDFFWETDFECLWKQYPDGFSDALFPNIGYTYLINLGTPFVMQLEENKYEIKSDGFLPRHKNMICHHRVGNKIFGIKFKVSPIVLEKKINFFEYREFIYPLAYLIDKDIIQKVKGASTFEKRVDIISGYYEKIITQHADHLNYVHVVTKAIQQIEESHFQISIEDLAASHQVSTRTLQRYFEATTSMTSKKVYGIMRIRKALDAYTRYPETFNYAKFGYYDYSHFYKHLKSFLIQHPIVVANPDLNVLYK